MPNWPDFQDNDFEKVISASLQPSFFSLTEQVCATLLHYVVAVCLLKKCWQGSKFFSSLSDQSLDGGGSDRRGKMVSLKLCTKDFYFFFNLI